MSEILAHVENSQAFDAASRSKSFYLARRLGLSSVGVKSRPGCRENPERFSHEASRFNCSGRALMMWARAFVAGRKG